MLPIELVKRNGLMISQLIGDRRVGRRSALYANRAAGEVLLTQDLPNLERGKPLQVSFRAPRGYGLRADFGQPSLFTIRRAGAMQSWDLAVVALPADWAQGEG